MNEIKNEEKNKDLVKEIYEDKIVLNCCYNICKYYNKESNIISKVLGEI